MHWISDYGGTTMIEFPEWLRPALVDQFEWLLDDLEDDDEIALLRRLATDPRMKLVWTQIYKRKRESYRQTEDFEFPAIVTGKSEAAYLRREAEELRAKGSEQEAQYIEKQAIVVKNIPSRKSRFSEQDQGAQRLLSLAFREALDLTPTYLAEIEEERKSIDLLIAAKQKEIIESWQHGRRVARLFEHLEDLIGQQNMLIDPARLAAGDDP